MPDTAGPEPAPAASAAATAAPATATPESPPPSRELAAAALIPVSLREAALDSPSFRASALHLADQVDLVERWLDGYVKATTKVAHEVLALEDSIGAYLTRITSPPAEAIVDQDYTCRALRRAAEGARDWWTHVVGVARRLDATAAEPTRAFLAGAHLRAFRDARRAMEQTQKVHDSALARYVAQSKTKEPSALREDAFAVFEARKAYLRASLDLCEAAPRMRQALDRVLVRVSTGVWGEVVVVVRRERAGAGAGPGHELDRIGEWAREMEASEAALVRETQAARREIAEATMSANRPSRELDDYGASTVPMPRGPATQKAERQQARQQQQQQQPGRAGAEKQGWLFLRTQAGKPVRTSWTRRWFYCREGVFGWLVQGPHGGGVLQGDEIGVLLCGAKPAPAEDRRFCFEVKTGGQSMMLQAETQVQLTEWLEVFDVARQLAFEASAALSSRLGGGAGSRLAAIADPAFSITPSSIPEFSARLLDAQVGAIEEAAAALERSGTLPPATLTGSQLALPATADPTRVSLDANATAVARRAIAALGKDLTREEGESGREHAARILRDWHRKAVMGTGVGTGTGAGLDPASAGGIAGLISASNSLLPGHPSATGTAVQSSASSPDARLAPPTLARPPMATLLSRAAAAAAAERGLGRADKPSRGLPAALMANYWGSAVWASPTGPSKPDDVVLEGEEGEMQEELASEDKGTVSAAATAAAAPSPSSGLRRDAAETFPAGYPGELRAQHAQFRLLFPQVSPDEKLVLVLRAGWSSSSSYGGDGEQQQQQQQQTPQPQFVDGRIYVTPDNVYFYGCHLSLIATGRVSLDRVTEVTAQPGPDYDALHLRLRGEPASASAHASASVSGHDPPSPDSVTIRTFLEDVYLLQARFNLLLDDLQSEEPMDLQEMVVALSGLAAAGAAAAADADADADARRSPSHGSWSPPLGTPTPDDDGGVMAGKATGRGRRRGSSASPAPRFPPHLRLAYAHAKVRLPSLPVAYAPEGMGPALAERHFEISAKSCFHALFGDKSIMFARLYSARRARQIAQGPWRHRDGDDIMCREFRFRVGADEDGGGMEVVDTQSVDVLRDHVTYVVAHTKTAWHLPHSGRFRVAARVVITHAAKSRCRLAVYARVEWAPPPTAVLARLSRWLVERQALDDAAAEADELAEAATEQVRRLGPHSRTRRAIQVFGQVGQRQATVMFAGGSGGAGRADTEPEAGRVAASRTLAAMMLDTARSFGESVVTSVILWALAALRSLWSVMAAHRVLILALVISVLANAIMSSREGSAWWAERRAARFMRNVGVGPNPVMSRAIRVVDLEGLVSNQDYHYHDQDQPRDTYFNYSTPDGDNGGDSACLATFKALVAGTDPDAPADDAGAGFALSSAASRVTARRLRRTRQHLGIRRHDLVVALRLVNRVEREVARAEWENWLGDEYARCDRLGGILRGEKDGEGGKDRQLDGLREWHEHYCGSCRAEVRRMAGQTVV